MSFIFFAKNNSLLHRATLGCLLCFGAQAYASGLMECDSGNPAGWQTQDALREVLVASGWQVRKTEVDEGCNGDGDGYCSIDMVTVGLPSVCPKGGRDCDDSDATVNPGHPEWCDGKDNNCDSKFSDAQLYQALQAWNKNKAVYKTTKAQWLVYQKGVEQQASELDT